jgi:hypothetical protein
MLRRWGQCRERPLQISQVATVFVNGKAGADTFEHQTRAGTLNPARVSRVENRPEHYRGPDILFARAKWQLPNVFLSKCEKSFSWLICMFERLLDSWHSFLWQHVGTVCPVVYCGLGGTAQHNRQHWGQNSSSHNETPVQSWIGGNCRVQFEVVLLKSGLQLRTRQHMYFVLI